MASPPGTAGCSGPDRIPWSTCHQHAVPIYGDRERAFFRSSREICSIFTLHDDRSEGLFSFTEKIRIQMLSPLVLLYWSANGRHWPASPRCFLYIFQGCMVVQQVLLWSTWYCGTCSVTRAYVRHYTTRTTIIAVAVRRYCVRAYQVQQYCNTGTVYPQYTKRRIRVYFTGWAGLEAMVS